MTGKELKHHLLNNGLYYFLILLTAWGLKYHYSRAGSEELVWVLAPTAGLVELISGIPFEIEAHSGFISQGYRIVIAPACAGINFLIIAFCMATFSGLHAYERHRSKLFWLGSSLLSAYLLTIFVNMIRIIVSIYSYNAQIQLGWLTAPRIHRLEGIVIYFFFLSLFYMIINKVIYRLCSKAARKKPAVGQSDFVKTNNFDRVCTGLTPLFWYGLITLGVPLINGALQENATRFAEHSIMVLAASSAVLGAILLVRIILEAISKKSFGPISLLGARFKSSKYRCIPPV
jgi:exosortase K